MDWWTDDVLVGWLRSWKTPVKWQRGKTVRRLFAVTARRRLHLLHISFLPILIISQLRSQRQSSRSLVSRTLVRVSRRWSRRHRFRRRRSFVVAAAAGVGQAAWRHCPATGAQWLGVVDCIARARTCLLTAARIPVYTITSTPAMWNGSNCHRLPPAQIVVCRKIWFYLRKIFSKDRKSNAEL